MQQHRRSSRITFRGSIWLMTLALTGAGLQGCYTKLYSGPQEGAYAYYRTEGRVPVPADTLAPPSDSALAAADSAYEMEQMERAEAPIVYNNYYDQRRFNDYDPWDYPYFRLSFNSTWRYGNWHDPYWYSHRYHRRHYHRPHYYDGYHGGSSGGTPPVYDYEKKKNLFTAPPEDRRRRSPRVDRSRGTSPSRESGEVNRSTAKPKSSSESSGRSSGSQSQSEAREDGNQESKSSSEERSRRRR